MPNVRTASAEVGGFSDPDAVAYKLGIQHIINTHGRIGSYTIQQVVDQERARQIAQLQAEERQRSAAAARVERQKEALEKQRQARLAAIAADQPTGDPECLKIKSWKSVTGDEDEANGIHIHGTVLNTCGDALSYVQIVFTILDSSGSNIGTAMANNTDLLAGESWTFSAIGIDQGTGSWRFRLAELSGH